MTPPTGTLRRAVALLDVDRRRVALALLLGTLALGCAIALAATAAWLIARASQMPDVLALSVATVAVRAFGIGRGVLRYVERLVSHDVALRGMTRLRTTLYERLAAGRPEALLRLRRGDLLARVGADVDAVGDVVVRGLLPIGVAALLGLATSFVMCLFWPPAGLALAGCLVLAGVAAPALASRGARISEQHGVQGFSDLNAAALGLLDDAGPLLVAGRVPREMTALRAADARIADATDRGAPSAALAAGIGQLAVGLAVLAALVTGIPAVTAGHLAAVDLAVIVLTPLAAFEATALLPAAMIQVHRSRAAAARVLALLDDGADPGAPAEDVRRPLPDLVAASLACAWPDGPTVVRDLDLALRPGRSIAIVGPSGTGKTTTLLTLAGLLPARSGSLTLDGLAVVGYGREAVTATVLVGTEDAHVFGTTVLENLRVARGDLTRDEASAVLQRVALGPWLSGLPDGLDTVLGPDARTVSGGERRRLLVARALVSPAPLLLLDEPAEHLDPTTADALVNDLLRDPRGVVVVTHRLSALGAADDVLWLDDGRVQARGTHAELQVSVPGYREALELESEGGGTARG